VLEVLGPARVLHDAVEGDELCNDDLPHLSLSFVRLLRPGRYHIQRLGC
jgi:hypothetical protein